jgi:hypothetical protein
MIVAQADHAPGFRRRIRISPVPGCVLSEVEDDYHCMNVSIHHDNVVAHTVKAVLTRAPWSTCPGAVDKCEQTFQGVALQDFPARGEKASNCTHLFDLALLAAAHALDDAPLVYDVFVSDPIDSRRCAEIFRNGELVLGWSDANYRIIEPAELAGMKLNDMRAWMDSLDPAQQEAARILRWVSMIAHGRTIPMDRQSDASRMPPSCYTFQPERAAVATRIGKIMDFSDGTVQPLDDGEIKHRDAAGSA